MTLCARSLQTVLHTQIITGVRLWRRKIVRIGLLGGFFTTSFATATEEIETLLGRIQTTQATIIDPNITEVTVSMAKPRGVKVMTGTRMNLRTMRISRPVCIYPVMFPYSEVESPLHYPITVLSTPALKKLV